MAGNVWEWTLDWYASYLLATAFNPTGPSSGTSRVIRGGQWADSAATNVRAAFRVDGRDPGRRLDYVGFRCARTPVSTCIAPDVSCLGGCQGARYASPLTLRGGSEIVGYVVADVTNDGLPDVIMANQLSNNVYVYPNNGAGGVGAAVILSTRRNTGGIAIANFNADPYIDAIISQPDVGGLQVLLGTVSGLTVGPTISQASAPRSLAATDFDRDGHVDLLMYLSSSNCFVVRLGDGSGGFGAAGSCILSSTAGEGSRLVPFDWDGDGYDEYVDLLTPGTLRVQRPSGGGAISMLTSLTVSATAAYAFTMDVTGDGRPELILPNHPSAGQVTIARPTASSLGTNCSVQTFGLSGLGTTGYTVPADFNRDGRVDWLYSAGVNGPLYLALQN